MSATGLRGWTAIALLAMAANGSSARADATANLPPLAVAATPRVVPADAAGGTVDVQLRVFNAGAVPMEGVVLRDELASGVTVVDSSPPPSARGAVLRWNLGTIEAGGFATVRLRLAVPSSAPAALDTGAVARASLGGTSRSATAATIEVRAIDASVAAYLAPTATADPRDALVSERVGQLGTDPSALFAHVRDDFGFEVYRGGLRGARGALLAGAANAYDRASLLVALLRAAGHPARFRFGTLSDADAAVLIGRMFPDPSTEAIATAHPDARALIDAGAIDRFMAMVSDADRATLDETAIFELETAAAEALLSATPTADPALLADAADHAWVEYHDGSGWVALDPSFADATPGTTRGTAVGAEEAAIPADRLHRLVFRVRAETYNAFASHDITYPARRTFTAAELSGVALTVRQSSDVSETCGLLGCETQHFYRPRMVALDLVDGDTTVHAFEGDTGRYMELFSASFGVANQVAIGAWLEVEHLAPGQSEGEGRTSEWTFFDRLGYAQRTLNGPAIGIERRELAAVDKTAITVVASGGAVDGRLQRLAAGHLADVAARSDAALDAIMGVDLDDPSAGTDPDVREAVTVGQTLGETLAGTVGAMFQAASDAGTRTLGGVHRTRAYFATPRLTFVRTSTVDVGGTDMATLAIDLRVNDVRTVPYPGQIPGAGFHLRMARGMLDALYEREVIRVATGMPTVTTLDVFDGVDAMGIPLMPFPALRPETPRSQLLTELEDMPISADARLRIVEAMRAGRTVYAPAEPAPLPGGGTGYAWWELSPDGELIAVTEDGGHAALIEYGGLAGWAAGCSVAGGGPGCGHFIFVGGLVGMAGGLLSFAGQVLQAVAEGREIKSIPDVGMIIGSTLTSISNAYVRSLIPGRYRVPGLPGVPSSGTPCVVTSFVCDGDPDCASMAAFLMAQVPYLRTVPAGLCATMYGTAAHVWFHTFNELNRAFEVDPPTADFATALPEVRGLATAPRNLAWATAAPMMSLSAGAIDETWAAGTVLASGGLARADAGFDGTLGVAAGELTIAGTDVTAGGSPVGSGDLAFASTGAPAGLEIGPGAAGSIDGAGLAAFHADGDDVVSGAQWSSVSASATGPTTLVARQRVMEDGAETVQSIGTLTLDGSPLDPDVYATSGGTITASGAENALSFPSGASASIDLSGATVASAGRVAYGLSSGALDVTPSGGDVSAHVTGSADRAVSVMADPATLTFTTTADMVFRAIVASSVSGDHDVSAVGPLGWTLWTDASGFFHARAPSGTPAGRYVIVIRATPADGLGPVASVELPVDLSEPTPGVDVTLRRDLATNVPHDGANLPTAFLLEASNVGAATDTYALEAAPVDDFTGSLGSSSLTVRSGETGRTGYLLRPTGGVPAAGTVLPLSVTATGGDASGTGALAFSMPEVVGSLVDPRRRAVNVVPGGTGAARFVARGTGNVANQLGLALIVTEASGALAAPMIDLPFGGVLPVEPTITAPGGAAIGTRGSVRLIGELAVGTQMPLPPTTREGAMTLRIVSSLGLSAWDFSDELFVRTRYEAAGAAEELGAALDDVALGCPAGDAATRDRVEAALRALVTTLEGDFASEVAALTALADGVAATSTCAELGGLDYGPIGDLDRAVRDAEPEVALSAALDPTSVAVGAGGEARASVAVTNTGFLADNAQLSATGPAGWEVLLPVSALSVTPGATRSATLLVRVPADAPLGTESVSITVTSATDPAITQTLALSVDVRDDVGVSVTIDPPRLAMGADAIAALDARILNRESGELMTTLSLDGTASIAARLDETELTIAGGEEAQTSAWMERPGEQLETAVHGFDLRARTAMNTSVGHADVEVLDAGRIAVEAPLPLVFTDDAEVPLTLRNLAGPGVTARTLQVEGVSEAASLEPGTETTVQLPVPETGVTELVATDEAGLASAERLRVIAPSPLNDVKPDGCGTVVLYGEGRGEADALEAAIVDADVLRVTDPSEVAAALGGDDRAVLVVIEPSAALLADPALFAEVEGGDGVVVLPAAIGGEDDLAAYLDVRAFRVPAVEADVRFGDHRLHAIGPGASLVGEAPAIRGFIDPPADGLSTLVTGPLVLNVEGEAAGALSLDWGLGPVVPFGGETRAADRVVIARVPAGAPLALTLDGSEGTFEPETAASMPVTFGTATVHVEQPDLAGMPGVWSGREIGEGRFIALHVDLLASARHDPESSAALEEALRAACGTAPLGDDRGDGGCGCRVVGFGPTPGAPLALVGAASAAMLLRRRRRAHGP